MSRMFVPSWIFISIFSISTQRTPWLCPSFLFSYIRLLLPTASPHNFVTECVCVIVCSWWGGWALHFFHTFAIHFPLHLRIFSLQSVQCLCVYRGEGGLGWGAGLCACLLHWLSFVCSHLAFARYFSLLCHRDCVMRTSLPGGGLGV